MKNKSAVTCKKIIFTLIALTALAVSCDIADDMLGVNEGILQDRVAPNISVIEGTSYAFVDEDNTLTLEVSDPQSGYTYYWSASAGTIERSGTSVTYTAPSGPGDAVISCYGAKDDYVETKTSTKTIHNIEILADNMLWLKADAITGLGNFDAVSSWDNTGPNAFALIQATAANQPRYVPSSLNGKPVVRFVDNTDMLYNTAITGTGFGTSLTRVTFFIVYRVNTFSVSYILGARNGGTNSFPVLYQPGAGQLRFYQYAAYNAVPFPVTSGSASVLSSVCDMTLGTAADRLKIWIDGEMQNDNINVAATNPYINRLYLGGLATTNSFIGDIAEVIYFNTALSDERRQQIESYLAEKWGI